MPTPVTQHRNVIWADNGAVVPMVPGVNVIVAETNVLILNPENVTVFTETGTQIFGAHPEGQERRQTVFATSQNETRVTHRPVVVSEIRPAVPVHPDIVA